MECSIIATEDSKKPEVYDFFKGEVTRDTGFKGICIDYKYGLRVKVPDNVKVNVRVFDMETFTLIYDCDITEGGTLTSEKKYYVKYGVFITSLDDGSGYREELNLSGRKVVIRFPNTTLGDVLAWVPYADEFRKKHNCQVKVMCSASVASILDKAYPKLEFITNDEYPKDFYAAYYVGTYFPTSDRAHQPVDHRHVGLQLVAPYILGLPTVSVRTKVNDGSSERTIKEPYVCIAVQSTNKCKYWNNDYGWVTVIKELRELGYRVLCIDRDAAYGPAGRITTLPWGCEDFTGALPLQERIDLLKHAEFFIGLPSGLSWLAWAVGTPVVMISGFTLPYEEFENPYRVQNFNVCTGCWHDFDFDHKTFAWCPRHEGTEREFECTGAISSSQVLFVINKVINDLKENKFVRSGVEKIFDEPTEEAFIYPDVVE